MRHVLLLLGAALVLTTAARPAEAQSTCVEKFPRGGLNLSGQLEGQQIRAFLDLGFPQETKDGVSGLFIYPDRWEPGSGDAGAFSLTGTITAACLLNLTDSEGGSWQLTFAAQALVGTWKSSTGSLSKVTLQVVPAMDCSGRGPWRTFTSKSWPITFEYPTSWRISERGDRIVLDCPDPALLAWGGSEIVLGQGRGTSEMRADDGRRGKRIDRFVSFDNQLWFVGEGCEEGGARDGNSVFCQMARQSVWRGMTVLQGAAGEDRHYRPGGGYVGQGGGVISYLFLSGDHWVSINSHDTPSFYDTLGTAGPVLFDGDGVIERLVRSIRRRPG